MPSTTAQPSFFMPLKLPDFRRLLISNALWWSTLFMEMILVGWLVFDMTDSAWSVSVIGFCRSAPFLVTGIFGGPITDRLGRRTVIVITQSTNLVVYGAIVLLFANGLLTLWYLAAASLVLGFAWSMEFPARRALVPDLVGKEQTVDALLLESFGQGISRIAGPFGAGWIIAQYGALVCFGIITTITLVSLLLVYQLSLQSIPRTTMKPTSSPWTLIGQGLRYVRRNEPILGVVLITVVMNLFIFPYITLLPVFAKDVLKQDAFGLGLLGTGTGTGAFLGLLLINYARKRTSGGWIFAVGTFVQCIGLALFALSTIYSASWALLFLAGVGQACFAIMQSSIILLAASDEMRSRAMGAVVLAIGSDPIGKLQIGLLAENFGAQTALFGQASVAAVAILAIAVFLPGMRRPIPQEQSNAV